MGILILQRPSRQNIETEDVVSNWSCSRLPYIFKFARRDATALSLYDTGGFLCVRFSSTGIDPSEITVGSSIFISAIDASAKIVNVTVAGSPYYDVVTDVAFTSGLSGGWVNVMSRQSYSLNVYINGYDASTGRVKQFAVANVTPDLRGSMVFDAQAFINYYMRKEDLFTYTALNKKDNNVWGWFIISYTERWSQSNNNTVTDNEKYFFLDAVKPLLSRYGQNLADYLPSRHAFPEPLTVKAKWLTDFPRSTYFTGWPFSLSVILPDEFDGVNMTLQEEKFDNNGASMGVIDNTVDTSLAGAVNRFTLSERNSPTPYAGASYVDVWLYSGDVVQRGYVVSGYRAVGYTELVPPTTTSVEPVEVTEHHRIRIVDGCVDSPVFIKWRNRLAGNGHWLFSRYQELQKEPSIEASVYTPYEDIATAVSLDKVTQMSVKNTITVGAVVSSQDAEGILGLLSSPFIQMLVDKDLVNTEPERAWLNIQIVPKAVKWVKSAGNVEIELTFRLPNDFTVSN